MSLISKIKVRIIKGPYAAAWDTHLRRKGAPSFFGGDAMHNDIKELPIAPYHFDR